MKTIVPADRWGLLPQGDGRRRRSGCLSALRVVGVAMLAWWVTR